MADSLFPAQAGEARCGDLASPEAPGAGIDGQGIVIERHPAAPAAEQAAAEIAQARGVDEGCDLADGLVHGNAGSERLGEPEFIGRGRKHPKNIPPSEVEAKGEIGWGCTQQ